MATKNAYQILSEKMKSQDFHKRITAYSPKREEDEEKKKAKNLYERLRENTKSQNSVTQTGSFNPVIVSDKEASKRLQEYRKLKAQAVEQAKTTQENALAMLSRLSSIDQNMSRALAEDEARKRALEQASQTNKRTARTMLLSAPTSSGKPTLVTPSQRLQNEQAADLAAYRAEQSRFVPKTEPTTVSKTADARRGFDVADIPEYIGNIPELASGVAQQAGSALGVFAETTARANGWRPIQEIGREGTTNTPAMRSYEEATKKINQIANQYKGIPKIAINAGTSMGRNILTLAASAVNPAVGMSMMGAMAAGDKAYELRLQDVSDNEAIMRGIVSGIIEGATEAVPFRKLANIAKTGGNGFIRNLAEQVLTEATEEAVAYTANYIADKAANDPNAIFDPKDLAYSAMLGGISGGIMGGGATAVNRVGNAIANRAQPKPIQQVVSEIQANPAQAALDPSTAATIIDPAQTETILTAMQEIYGKDANGNVTPETSQRAFEATKNLIQTAKNTVNTYISSQKATQEENAVSKGNTADTKTRSESLKTAQEYIQKSNLSDDLKKAYSAIVNNSRYNIRFDEQLNTSIGGYNTGTEVVINPNSEQGLDYLITHEIGHYGESNEMIDFALQALKESGYTASDGSTVNITDETLQTAVDNIKADYAEIGVQIDDDTARAELAMKYYAELLKGDVKTLQRIAKEKPTFIQRIIEAIDDLITKLAGTEQAKRLVDLRKRFVDGARGGTATVDNARFAIGDRLENVLKKRDTVSAAKTERSEAVAEIRKAVKEGVADNEDINRLIVAEREVAKAQKELALAEQQLSNDERAEKAKVKADQRVFDTEQKAKSKAERKQYVQFWKDALNKAETELNLAWQIAKEKHKGDVKLQKALEHFKQVQERDKARRAERAERVDLLNRINKVLKADTTGYIKRVMRDAFEGMDTQSTSLNIAGATANPARMDMIQVNDLSIEDVRKLTDILKDINRQITDQKKTQGYAKKGEIYREAAVKVKDLLRRYQKVDIKPADNEVVKTAKALANSQIEKKTVLQKVKSTADVLYHKLVDAGRTVEKIGKIAQDNELYPLYDNARKAKQSAEHIIMVEQTNAKGEAIGDSLVSIFEPIRKQGDDYYNAFQTYMYHRHNIARMEQGKPVFNDITTAEKSVKAIAEAEALHPEFVGYAKKVYRYLDNLMQYRVDTGLISQQQAEMLREQYPNYVPTFRTERGRNGAAGSRATGRDVSIAQTVKSAEGSDADLMPLHESIARQTMQTIQAGKRNVFANRLLYDAIQHKEKLGEYVQEVIPTSQMLDIDSETEQLPELPSTILFYVNGKGVQLKLSEGLYEGLEAISSNVKHSEVESVIRSIAEKPNELFKKLVTAYNPMFFIRNPIRDIQDAGIYSKNLTEFAKQFPEAIKQIKSNGKLWRQYQALGGFGSSIFDYQKGYDQKKLNQNPALKVLDKTEEMNMIVEQLPRFAEFMATVAKGGNSYNNLVKAMYNAADVTVNFGRSGKWGKTINSTFVPFFNPAIQGFDKMVRVFTRQPSARQFSILALRAAALGIAPSVLNALMYQDDEDYKNLRDSDKDLNYLLKVGDNLWLKIPKGRVLSLFGNAAQRAMRTPEEGAKAWAGYINTALNQVAPINPFISNIASALKDSQLFMPDNPGTTWYGAPIEPERLRNFPVGERYDETTDYFSKWLGKVLGYSPKKIKYLLDSYTGVIGDILLPLMTPRAERNPFISAFVVDGALSNKISREFYQRRTELTEEYNSYVTSEKKKAELSVVLRYYNKVAASVSALNNEIRAIESDTTMSNSEKRTAVKELRATISGIQMKLLSDIDKYQSAVKKYLTGTDDASKDRAYLYANRDTFGAEYAISTYNKNTYQKAAEAYEMGVPYSKYFDMFIANTPDTDGNGSITQEEMKAMLDKSGLSKKQKAFLFEQQNKSWKNNPYK